MNLLIKQRFGHCIVFGLFLFLSAEWGFSEDKAVLKAGADAAKTAVKTGVRFDLEALSKPPAVFPADDISAEGVKAFYYEGAKYQEKPTRVFAYYGVPAGSGDGKKVPAMVLIHGGGGSAFDRWVKLWNSRGYAAIAMDVCGCVPVGTYGKWQRHEHGGPPGWDASFSQLDAPVEDQWTFQAVSAVALAHSLIRSYPEVDADRIGVTGISWGRLSDVGCGGSRFAIQVRGSRLWLWLPR